MIGLIGLSQCGQAAGGTPGSEPTKRRKATKEVLKGKKGQMVQVFAQGGLTQHTDPLDCAFFNAVHRICEQPVWACADLQPRTRKRAAAHRCNSSVRTPTGTPCASANRSK